MIYMKKCKDEQFCFKNKRLFERQKKHRGPHGPLDFPGLSFLWYVEAFSVRLPSVEVYFLTYSVM